MECVCGGKARPAKIEYKLFGIAIGKYPGYVCSKCKEEWFNEEIVEKIENKVKEMGLFGLAKQQKVSIAGNSLIVRIPKPLAKFVGIKEGSLVRIEPEGKERIGIEKISEK
jgi:hypothetical protein